MEKQKGRKLETWLVVLDFVKRCNVFSHKYSGDSVADSALRNYAGRYGVFDITAFQSDGFLGVG